MKKRIVMIVKKICILVGVASFSFSMKGRVFVSLFETSAAKAMVMGMSEARKAASQFG